MITLRELSAGFAGAGRVEAIVLRPDRGEAAFNVDSAQALPGRGLLGDRRAARAAMPGLAASKREITLIQAEHLLTLARWLRREAIDARLLRRNLVVSGLNLVSMRSPFADQRLVWRIGAEVLIEVTGPCDPCSRMEQLLGPGGYNAMRGLGGVTARVQRGGRILLGDSVEPSSG